MNSKIKNMKKLILSLVVITLFIVGGATATAQTQTPKGKTTIVKKDVKTAPSNTLTVPKKIDKIAPSDQKPKILPDKKVDSAPKTDAKSKEITKPKIAKGIVQPVPDSEVKK